MTSVISRSPADIPWMFMHKYHAEGAPNAVTVDMCETLMEIL